MAKKMSDMIPPDGDTKNSPSREERRIPKPSNGKPRKKVGKVKRTMFGGIRPDDGEKKLPKTPKRILWGVAAVAIIFLLISISTVFEHATLKITPKQKTFDLDFVFTAVKNSEDSEKIPFEVLTLPLSDSITVPATETKEVERRAQGEIIIYNDYKTSPQRLIKNTRFETPEGLIYRIPESVVVPGQTNEGGELVPGSVEAIVYADNPGDEYNVDRTDFTLPGFKGSAEFESYYARSKTPMTGGYIGTVQTISEEEFENAKEELRNRMTSELMETVGAKKPEGFILFDDGIFIEFGNTTHAEEQSPEKNEVTIEERAELQGILFNKDVLSQRLALKIVPNLEPHETVEIVNLEDLTFKLLNKDTLTIAEETTISFSLSGRPHFVWIFPEEELIKALLGSHKDKLKEVLEGFSSITQAEVVIRPFWKRTFPEERENFSIERIITQ